MRTTCVRECSKSHAYRSARPSNSSSPITLEESWLFFEHTFGVIYQNKTALPVENSNIVINRLGEVGDDDQFRSDNTPKLYDGLQQLHSKFSPSMHDFCYILLHIMTRTLPERRLVIEVSQN